MATTFQPERPHDPARRGTGKAFVFVTALLTALAVIMLLAVTSPRLFSNDTTNWLVTFGAGILAFVVVAAIGLARSERTGRPVRHAPGRSQL